MYSYSFKTATDQCFDKFDQRPALYQVTRVHVVIDVISMLIFFQYIQMAAAASASAAAVASANSSGLDRDHGSSPSPSATYTSHVQQTIQPGEKLSKTNLYIRGLPSNTTDEDLVNMCKQ